MIWVQHKTLANIKPDHQDLRFRKDGNISRTGSTICHRICKCLCPRLELWKIQGINLSHHSPILLVSGTYNGLNLQLSWETTLVPAPRSKKAALIAIANCVSQCSHWYSPYFFPRSQEPFYRLGGGLILFGCLCTALLAWTVKWWAKKLNKKLNEAEGYSEHSGVERGWRYVY
jgi:hypothetical protein